MTTCKSPRYFNTWQKRKPQPPHPQPRSNHVSLPQWTGAHGAQAPFLASPVARCLADAPSAHLGQNESASQQRLTKVRSIKTESCPLHTEECSFSNGISTKMLPWFEGHQRSSSPSSLYSNHYSSLLSTLISFLIIHLTGSRCTSPRLLLSLSAFWPPPASLQVTLRSSRLLVMQAVRVPPSAVSTSLTEPTNRSLTDHS